jgi:hypothetical protein
LRVGGWFGPGLDLQQGGAVPGIAARIYRKGPETSVIFLKNLQDLRICHVLM